MEASMDVLIVDALPLMPSGLDVLQSSASEEGVKNVSRLIQDWNLGKTLFDGTGECLFIAQVNEMTAGVGGVLKCKIVPGALRVSRFYVLPEWRKKGIASAIANESLIHAREFADVITCNAQASEIAAPFWESLGFTKVNISGLTHILQEHRF
jgi:GNAT superfamily N-acetyltransferase